MFSKTWFRGGLIAFAAGAVACAAKPATLREAQLQDIAAIEQGFIAKERAFTPATRQRAQGLAEELKAKAGTLSPEQLFLGIAQIVATADNGHSVAGFQSDDAGPQQALPLAVSPMERDAWLILAAAPAYGDLAGSRVTKVEGVPVRELMDRLSIYYGGTPERRAILAIGLVTRAGFLQALGLAPSASKLGITVQRQDGTELVREIAYVARGAVPKAWWPSRWWSPDPVPGAEGWRTAISRNELPLYLQGADQLTRMSNLPDLDAVYLQFWTNENGKGVEQFVQRADRALVANPPKNIIVDLRFDKGGNLNTNAAFMRRLPGLTEAGGTIYVITGRFTFSAGIVAAGIVKKAGGSRVKIVGEPIGDHLRFWSEWDATCAANSKICAQANHGYFDLVDGCDGEPGCWADNRKYDFVVGRLDPELPAPTTIADYLAKRDPAMEAIVADIRSR